jgi:hypothetical protein
MAGQNILGILAFSLHTSAHLIENIRQDVHMAA